MAKQKGKRRRLWLTVLTLVVVAGLGGVGWYHAQTLTCRRIDVSGTRHADPAELLERARVDTGMVLFDLEPHLLEDRLAGDPWVQAADVTRLPTGTLSIRIQERTPVALALDATGSPSRYLDRFGFAMPLVRGAHYDVPLLRGVKPEPARPLDQPAARALLEALAGLDAETDALISEFELRSTGEVWLYTAPAGTRGAIPVRLGSSGFAPKLARLKAFWHQAVLTRPEVKYAQVDLRFDSQVVTQEEVTRP